MYFLVDLENVQQNGLNGTNLLKDNDKVIIFHNNTQKGINSKFAEDIIEKATLETITLVRNGKNNLDFYIATMVGEISKENPNETIAIISNDKGYIAVHDFCKERYSSKIIIAKDICNAINVNDNNLTQEQEFASKPQKYTFEDMLVKNKEVREKKAVNSLNKELQTVSKIEINEKDLELVDIYTERKIPFKMYNSLVHKYGKKEGTRIYHVLKEYTDKKETNNER